MKRERFGKNSGSKSGSELPLNFARRYLLKTSMGRRFPGEKTG